MSLSSERWMGSAPRVIYQWQTRAGQEPITGNQLVIPKQPRGGRWGKGSS